MGNLVNRVVLPVKCSMCGNKMVRVQYTTPFDRHIHTLDYCPECDKERDYKLSREIDSERKANEVNRTLMTIFLVLGIIASVVIILKQLGFLAFA